MRSGQYIQQIAGYKAFIPKPLPPEPPLVCDDELREKLRHAMQLLSQLDGFSYALPNIELFIAMYVKKEALLSSQIEGTQASLENVLEFESGMPVENLADIEEVINYIKALNYGIKRLEHFPMSLRLIKELHAILLDQVRGKNKTPGEFKRSQNWIGAPGSTLHTAFFVPPPPDETMKALADLEKYMHEGSIYAKLIDCALIHYQFETIHPFLDGNGRVGRLLITLYLLWKGTVKKPFLYLSYFFKKNRQEYYDRLTMTRQSGNYEQWVLFFIRGVIETAQSAIEDTKSILALQQEHQNLIIERGIASPYAYKLLYHLFSAPIVSIKDTQVSLKITYPTASHLITQFVNNDIIREMTGKKRSRRFAYTRYLSILSEGTQPL